MLATEYRSLEVYKGTFAGEKKNVKRGESSKGKRET